MGQSLIQRESDNLIGGPQTICVGQDYWINKKVILMISRSFTLNFQGEKFDEGKVHLLSNGSLIFDKIQKTDYAGYSFPNGKKKFC